MSKKLLPLTLLIFALLLAVLLPLQAAQADTFAVTNTNDSGSGSLRQAITDANDHPGADIITFSAATNGIPIFLAAPAGEDLNVSGDLDILDGGDLTIQGNGPANTIIDGGGADRVFHVCPGGCTQTVTLTGMTIQNGLVVSGGGGIRNAADTLIVDGSVIRNNIAINGGGITNLATLIIQNGSVIGGAGAGNRAYTGNGGGIYNFSGSTTVDNSTISANLADNNGGGIWSQATLDVQNGCIIGGTGAGNTATNNGGGIYNYDAGVVSVDGSTVSANTATNGVGGGIVNLATLTVQNGSSVSANHANLEGGGIYNDAIGMTTIQDSTVSTNTAERGGGIYNISGATTVNNSSINANSVTFDGGGIYNSDTLNVQDGSIIGESGAGNSAVEGGGIYNDNSGTATIDNSTVSANSVFLDGGGINNDGILNLQNGSIIGGSGAGNTAERGGGIYNESTGTATVDGSMVSANSVTVDGGGIYNYAILNVQNGSIIGGSGAGNEASRGGGIYNESTGTATVDGSTVSANSVTIDGGGIYNYATLVVQNGSIIGRPGESNTANNSGGGIYNEYSGTTTVDDSTVSANSANYGGGIYNLSTLNVQNGSIIGGVGAGNTANNNGGGIDNSEGKTTISNSTVSANSANNGGGIVNYGTTIVDSSTVSLNSATNNGGGIYTEADDSILTVDGGSTISANSANLGGGIYTWHDSTTTVTGSRILNNTAATNGGGVFSDINFAEDTSVSGSCIVGNSYMAFFNNQPEWQIAIGNWWGAATGPNSPGADTVFGNVDYSGFLTSPILNCAPELQVSKVNDTRGDGIVGTPFHWTLTIVNTGLFSTTFKISEPILVDDLPSGPTYSAPAAGNFVDVANSANIDCSLAGNTLTCEPTGGSVTLGPVTGSFEVTFSVTPNAAVTLVNPAGICQVDPDEVVTEGDESNNNCPTNVVNVTTRTTNVYVPLVLR